LLYSNCGSGNLKIKFISSHCKINEYESISCKVDGIAAAAGCQLVAMCDIVVTSNNATFSTPGVNLNNNNIKVSFTAK
jgi:hypothetical protein